MNFKLSIANILAKELPLQVTKGIAMAVLCASSILCAHISYGTTITSATSGNWTNTATWDCTCIPGITDSVIILSGHTVTQTKDTTIQALTINSSGVLDNGGYILNFQEISSGAGTSFTINGTYTGSGATKWLINTNPAKTIIAGGGTVSTSGLWTINSTSAGATIKAGAILTFSSSSGITISGGTLYCFGNITLASGSISVSSKTFQVESPGIVTLTSGNISVGIGKVYNYGEVTVGGDISGTSSFSSKWYNCKNSTLNVAGSFFYSGGSKGNIIADSSGNTVNYNGAGNQVINTNNEVTFWNLKCSNAGTKTATNTASSDINIYGDFTIQNSAQFAFAEYSMITIYGNWINTSDNADPFDETYVSDVQFIGSSAQSISSAVAGGETFTYITINNPGLTLNNCNINVSERLDLMAGLINTGIYEVNIINNATTSLPIYDGAYINGNLRRSLDPAGGSYDFPVGNANAYELATVNFTGAHTVGNLLVNFSNPASSPVTPTLTDASGEYINVLNCGGIAQGTGNATDGVWTITPDAGTATYDITLKGNNYDNNQAAHTVLKRTDASSPWVLDGTYQWSNLAEPIVAARTGLSGFSQFAIGGSMNALPIELLNFEARANGDKVELSWTTATETNNDFFTVERFTPSILRTSPPNGGETSGIDFTPIGTVKGAGNSNILLNYRLVDESPLSLGEGPGVRYYRLKQTDFDGKFSYSQLVSIELHDPGTIILYPNPTKGIVNLNISGEKEEQLCLSFIDKLGRTVIKKEVTMKEGQNSFNIEVSVLNPGSYLLQMITTSGVKEIRQLIIEK